jgi:hypothetical protein
MRLAKPTPRSRGRTKSPLRRPPSVPEISRELLASIDAPDASSVNTDAVLDRIVDVLPKMMLQAPEPKTPAFYPSSNLPSPSFVTTATQHITPVSFAPLPPPPPAIDAGRIEELLTKVADLLPKLSPTASTVPSLLSPAGRDANPDSAVHSALELSMNSERLVSITPAPLKVATPVHVLTSDTDGGGSRQSRSSVSPKMTITPKRRTYIPPPVGSRTAASRMPPVLQDVGVMFERHNLLGSPSKAPTPHRLARQSRRAQSHSSSSDSSTVCWRTVPLCVVHLYPSFSLLRTGRFIGDV